MGDPAEIVLASRNPHKLAELGSLLAPRRLVALPEEVSLPPETGSSFADNALIKARATARATGQPSLADDSGIVVEALGGAPGVTSARYAGQIAGDAENLAKLLADLADSDDRRAAYVCVLALVEPGPDGPRELVVEGRCEGTIALEPRGDGGFGYDPAFVAAEYADADLTMAQICQAAKDAISHRGRAARALVERLDQTLAQQD